jgi:hypothetical protein
LGIAVKLIPLALLPLCYKKIKNKKNKIEWKSLAVLVLMLTLLFLPFGFVRPCWLKVFGQVTLQRPPWETVWALLAKQYSFSYLGPVPDVIEHSRGGEILRSERLKSRFSTDISYLQEPSDLFKIFYFVCGLGILGIFYKGWKALPLDAGGQELIAFAGFSLTLFFLYSKGWSPQFLIYLLPIILLGLADKLWIAIALTTVNLIEMPLWVSFFPESVSLLAVVVFMRTGLLIYCAYLFWQRMGNR